MKRLLTSARGLKRPTDYPNSAPNAVLVCLVLGLAGVLMSATVFAQQSADDVIESEDEAFEAAGDGLTDAVQIGLEASLVTGEPLLDGLNTAELDSLRRTLRALDLEHDSNPDGRQVGTLYIVTEEVFRTPWLQWLNFFHATTRDLIIEDEVLWEPGTAYSSELLDETGRNLRRRDNFSVVAIIPVQTDDPNVVDVLAVTRDTWSLRLSTNLSFADGVLSNLLVSLTERNFLGLHKTLAAIMLYQPDTIQVGGAFVDPRFFRTRLNLTQDFRVVINHDNGDFEGTVNFTELFLPLYSLDATWGFRVAESHDISIDRSFIGNDIRTWDDPSTLEVEEVPFIVDQIEIEALAEVFFGVGRTPKHIFATGWGVAQGQFALLADVDQDQAAAFEAAVLPRSEFSSFLNLGWRFFAAEFISLQNYQTFAFSEDVQGGYDLEVEFDLAPQFLGSDRDFVRAAVELGHFWTASDWVVDAKTRVSARYDFEGGDVIDQTLQLAAHFATPELGPFRLHLGGTGTLLRNRVTAALLELGGDNGLRGYGSNAFIGESRLVGHVELRTLPLELFTQFFGLIVFLDAATAFNEGDDPPLYADVGIGLRWVSPQLRRVPLRIDYAFPIAGPSDPLPGVFTFGFEQVF